VRGAPIAVAKTSLQCQEKDFFRQFFAAKGNWRSRLCGDRKERKRSSARNDFCVRESNPTPSDVAAAANRLPVVAVVGGASREESREKRKPAEASTVLIGESSEQPANCETKKNI